MDGCRDDAGAVRCHALAAIVTDIVLTLARERAVDGRVSLEDIDRIGDLVRGGTMTLDNKLKTHEENCRRHHTKPKGNIGARANPFNRLMVRPFEHLLAGDSPVFSRPYLGNYFDFLHLVFGHRLSRFEDHCRSIVQALLVVHGNNLTWEDFYAEPRTVKTLVTALKVLTHTLQSPEGQRIWYGCMARPIGDGHAPDVKCIDEVLTTLLATHRGLSAQTE